MPSRSQIVFSVTKQHPFREKSVSQKPPGLNLPTSRFFHGIPKRNSVSGTRLISLSATGEFHAYDQ